ncbi:prolyl aminopeptidase [Azospirillum sp. sgz301742]
MPRSELFPPIDPFAFGMLPVDDLHTIYWEQCGNPRGVPVVFLHGGPGAGASPTHRRFFDPHHYRIIIFDQRGAGRSTPLGEVRRNDTDLLIGDLEALRRHLAVERWHLFGGSWGSTLALAYAQAHPQRCLGMMLRGIFLMRKAEIDWFLYQMRVIFPEAWLSFVSHIPLAERGDLLEAYWRRLDSPEPAVRMAAARAWSIYEGACSSLLPSPELIAASGEDNHALGLARIEAHYFRANRYTPEDRLLRDLPRIRHLPAVIVQGRYDIVCPITTADELHRAWPEADYRIVADAGHSAMEPGIRAALVQATERFKDLR